MKKGTLFVLGMGPGDPELITLKAVRILGAAPVVAAFAKRGEKGYARSLAAPHLRQDAELLHFDYPITTELPRESPAYRQTLAAFYDEAAAQLAARLEAGADVALLAEGDPFLYGSAIPLFARLSAAFATEVVPGVSGLGGAWARARLPIAQGAEVLSIIPATLDAEPLACRLRSADAAVIIKLGRHLGKVRAVLEAAGRWQNAVYVERATMAGERILPAAELTTDEAPYFSLLLVPSGKRR